MNKTSPMNLYATPFSAAYWREAANSLRNVRCLVFAALMVAAANILSQFSIPVGESLKISFGFLARATCALVCGPVLGVTYGFVEDILSYVLKPSGVFFPGYTLTTMLGMLIYALCFYRAKLTVTRIFMAKLLTNVMNVFLGSVWSAVLYSKGYLYYMTSSAVKNTALLIPQTLMLLVLFQALIPILQRMGGIVPTQVQGRIRLI